MTQHFRTKRWTKIVTALAVEVAILGTGAPSVHAHHEGWTSTGSLTEPRWAHTSTRLNDGRVLVAGGFTAHDRPVVGPESTASAELYDPTTGSWTLTAPMAVARNEHTATLLRDGRVLVAGGYGEATAEIYDPRRGTWRPTGLMAVARNRHTATLLPDGRVLVAGGDVYFTPVASAEVFDPETGTWSPTGSLGIRRVNHTANLLPNGTVLVAGGETEADIRYSATYDLDATEIWHPSDTSSGLPGSWRPGPNLRAARSHHTATTLSDGRVLVTGGDSALSATELYVPGTNAWTIGGPLVTGRRAHTATALPSGRVLLVAGDDRGSAAEVYDPATGNSAPTAPLSQARFAHAAAALSDGRVVVAAGGDGVASAEVFTEHVMPALSIEDVAVVEGDKHTKVASFAIVLSSASSESVAVSYATADGTARAGRDYSATAGTVTFAPGQVRATVSVTVMGDRLKEADETFFVRLSSVTGATVADAEGAGTIVNDD